MPKFTHLRATRVDVPTRLIEEARPEPDADNGEYAFWTGVTDDGREVAIDLKTAKVAAESGAVVEDSDLAYEFLADLHVRASLSGNEHDLYLAPLIVHDKRGARARADRAAKATPGEPCPTCGATPAPQLLSKAQVAGILGVSTRTVERWAGNKIPQAIRFGPNGDLHWKADVLVNFLNRAA
jgi:hypothetical protein